MLSSLISLYYYLTVVRQMYIEPAPAWAMEEAEDEDAAAEGEPPSRGAPSKLIVTVLAALTLGVIFVGIYPFPLLQAIKAATGALLAAG